MRLPAPAGGKNGFWTGLFAALSATFGAFLLVELWPGAPRGTFLVCVGLILVAGVMLLTGRTWCVGVGFMVGAVVSLAGAVLIAGIWIAQHTV
jgi:hypothetical protein